MFKLTSSSGYIIAKNKTDVKLAMSCRLCTDILLELGNTIYIWKNLCGEWKRERYTLIGDDKEVDLETTGLKAYQSFYSYCGSDEVEKMKHIYEPIPMWESYEQIHYANLEFAGEKMYKNIYEFDANSAFTYGVLKLPDGFDVFKEYMLELYDKKKNTTNKLTRSKYKNLQNYLIGYFARIKDFIRVRSEIIKECNINIQSRMAEINNKGGNVYISNTDSIITDEKGAEVMYKYIGTNVGQFKLELKTNKLCYLSSNAYQLGDKVVYSGVKYFARKHIDMFNDIFCEQNGSLIEEKTFVIFEEENQIYKLCSVGYGTITVNKYNAIGELIDIIKYKAG